MTIALQSVGAFAADPQTHQLDAEHLQTEHTHSKEYKTSSVIYDEDGHNIKDCHHCGHCSGSHLHWFIAKHLPYLPTAISSERFSTFLSLEKAHKETQYKPPKV